MLRAAPSHDCKVPSADHTPSSYVLPSPGRKQGRRAATQVDKRRRPTAAACEENTNAGPASAVPVRSFVRQTVRAPMRNRNNLPACWLASPAGRAVDLRYVQLYVILPHSMLAWRPAAHSKPSNSRYAGLVLTDRPRTLAGRVVSIRRTAAMRAGGARLTVESG